MVLWNNNCIKQVTNQNILDCTFCPDYSKTLPYRYVQVFVMQHRFKFRCKILILYRRTVDRLCESDQSRTACLLLKWPTCQIIGNSVVKFLQQFSNNGITRSLQYWPGRASYVWSSRQGHYFAALWFSTMTNKRVPDKLFLKSRAKYLLSEHVKRLYVFLPFSSKQFRWCFFV